MKILLINNAAFIRSGEKLCVDERTGNFAKELQSLGNEIAFFQQEVANEGTVSMFDLATNNINAYTYKSVINRFITYLYGYLKLILLLLKYDCVYVFYPCNFKYIIYIASLLGKKSGLYVRGMNGIYSSSSQRLYKSIDVAFTVSQDFTDYINGISKKNIAYTIKPMIKFEQKDIELNRSYSKNDDQFNILFLGRISKDKGISELILAIHELRNQSHNIICTIVGDGADLDYYKDLVREKQLADVVKFTGAIHDPQKIKSYYQSADCYVLPTYHEGFPRTLYESMIFGTPIITTFVGGIPSLMRDDFNCKRIEVKSVDSIVTQISSLFENYSDAASFLAGNATNTINELLSKRSLSHAEHLDKILKSN